MSKIDILYIVSTLQRSGPTNQLLNIIKNLDLSRFQAKVLTLSEEPNNTRIDDFLNARIEVSCLKLSRIGSLVKGRKTVEKYIAHHAPDIIHTQGIRSDSILRKISLTGNCNWVATARNFPEQDYPPKFGLLKGWLMVKQHLKVFRSPNCNLVACSKSLSEQLTSIGIQNRVIRNGVHATAISNFSQRVNVPRTFVTVGSLIPRKNVALLLKAMKSLIDEPDGIILKIVGDGPLRSSLEEEAPKNVVFSGECDDVDRYLQNSDAFISASMSEGMPNAVLEALACGLPVLLSDIAPHAEIADVVKQYCHLFPLVTNQEELANLMRSFELPSTEDRSTIIDLYKQNFTADRMSGKYQEMYAELDAQAR